MSPCRVPARPALVASLLSGALALSACGGATESAGSAEPGESVEIQHAQGSTSVPVKPARVAVLDFGVLDTVDALGGNVVAVPHRGLPAFLEKFTGESYTDIGTMQEPDMERLAAAEPDVILIGGRSAPKYAELAKIAPTLDLSLTGNDAIADAKEQAQQIGSIFDGREQVERELATLDDTIERVAGKAANAGTGLVLMSSGGKVSAFGPESRFGVIHRQLGVKPAMGELSTDRHGQALSFEAIASADPDHLFVIDRDAAIGQSGAAAARVLDNALVNRTKAATNDKITYLDGQRWYIAGSGLRNLPAMVAVVEASFD